MAEHTHHIECPFCGERLAIGATQCHHCWKPVAS